MLLPLLSSLFSPLHPLLLFPPPLASFLVLIDMIRVVDVEERERDVYDAKPRAVAWKMCSLKTWFVRLPVQVLSGGRSFRGVLVPSTHARRVRRNRRTECVISRRTRGEIYLYLEDNERETFWEGLISIECSAHYNRTSLRQLCFYT